MWWISDIWSAPEKFTKNKYIVPDAWTEQVIKKKVLDFRQVVLISKNVNPRTTRRPVRKNPRPQERKSRPNQEVFRDRRCNTTSFVCKFQKACRRRDCIYAHALTEFEVDLCRFKNRCRKPHQCRFRHPSESLEVVYKRILQTVLKY